MEKFRLCNECNTNKIITDFRHQKKKIKTKRLIIFTFLKNVRNVN